MEKPLDLSGFTLTGLTKNAYIWLVNSFSIDPFIYLTKKNKKFPISCLSKCMDVLLFSVISLYIFRQKSESMNQKNNQQIKL